MSVRIFSSLIRIWFNKVSADTRFLCNGKSYNIMETRIELAKYCRSLLKWIEENRACIHPFEMTDLLNLAGQLLECA
jgi:hypothetical protein